MQSEGVFIAIVATVVATVVAAFVSIVAIVVVAVGAFGSPLFGLLIPNVEVVIISSGGRPRARATIVSFDRVARCKSSSQDTPSATDAGGPLDG
jgi:hypothetical protein